MINYFIYITPLAINLAIRNSYIIMLVWNTQKLDTNLIIHNT